MKMSTRHVSVFTGLLFSFFMAVTPVVSAGEHDVAEIYVMVSLAVPGGDQVDPRLGQIREELKSTFAPSSYEMLDEVRFDLDLQEQDSKPLPGDAHLFVQYMGNDDGKVNLNVRITQQGREVLNTNFSIPRGGTIIVGGPPYKNGNLVLSLRTTLN